MKCYLHSQTSLIWCLYKPQSRLGSALATKIKEYRYRCVKFDFFSTATFIYLQLMYRAWVLVLCQSNTFQNPRMNSEWFSWFLRKMIIIHFENIGKPCMIEETLIDESGKYGGIIDIVFEAEKYDAFDSNGQNSRQIIVVDWKWGKRPSKTHMAKYGEVLFNQHVEKFYLSSCNFIRIFWRGVGITWRELRSGGFSSIKLRISTLGKLYVSRKWRSIAVGYGQHQRKSSSSKRVPGVGFGINFIFF